MGIPGACSWDVEHAGVNPLNGSDAFQNPDGDGFDVNLNGVLEPEEQFVNWLEYHLRDGLWVGNQSLDGDPIPNNWTTDLFRNISSSGQPLRASTNELMRLRWVQGAALTEAQVTPPIRIRTGTACRMGGRFGSHDGMCFVMISPSIH